MHLKMLEKTKTDTLFGKHVWTQIQNIQKIASDCRRNPKMKKKKKHRMCFWFAFLAHVA